MRGVDGRPTTLLGEGIAVLNIQDPNDNIIYRIAVPALLSSEGITLLSVEQLHQQDGVGYLRPNDDSDAYLFTGNVNNPSRKLPLKNGFNGLDYITPLTDKQVEKRLRDNCHLVDFTSSPPSDADCDHIRDIPQDVQRHT